MKKENEITETIINLDTIIERLKRIEFRLSLQNQGGKDGKEE